MDTDIISNHKGRNVTQETQKDTRNVIRQSPKNCNVIWKESNIDEQYKEKGVCSVAWMKLMWHAWLTRKEMSLHIIQLFWLKKRDLNAQNRYLRKENELMIVRISWECTKRKQHILNHRHACLCMILFKGIWCAFEFHYSSKDHPFLLILE